MDKFKYNPGDRLGPKQVLMLERLDCRNGRRWWGKFQCLSCKKPYEAQLDNVVSGKQCYCSDCAHKNRRKIKEGQTFGPYNTILIKRLEENKIGHTFIGLYQCGHCGKEFKARHGNLSRAGLFICQECSSKKGRIGDYAGKNKEFKIIRCLEEKNPKGGGYLYEFQCPYCDNTFITTLNVANFSRTSCGCKSKNFSKDLTGQKIGEWTVLKRSDKRDKAGHRYWWCVCSCGKEKEVSASSLLTEESLSCGHLHFSRGEEKIKKILSNFNINYETQWTQHSCKSLKGWSLRFDFYLPDYNICIEYDGEQHFKEWSLGNTTLKERQLNDQIKNQYCKDNNIKLIRIPYTEKNIEQCLLNEIFS